MNFVRLSTIAGRSAGAKETSMARVTIPTCPVMERRVRAWMLAVSFGGALLAASGSALAQYEPIPGPATDVYPGTREYRWTFYVPVMTIERHEFVFRGVNPIVRSRRFDYETPGLRYERRKLGEMPEFYCKYPDWALPNECGVRWHVVYADFPQLTMRREHIDADVVEWRTGEQTIRIDVPRWTWTEKTLTLVVPVLNTEPMPEHPWSKADDSLLAQISIDGARAKLEAGEKESLKVLDDAVAALGSGIAAIEAEGEDPSKATSSDGTPVDLYATRKALLADKAEQVERFASIRAELDSAQARTRPVTH
jgi:hypothetical protein